jgi:hypothetical protein
MKFKWRGRPACRIGRPRQMQKTSNPPLKKIFISVGIETVRKKLCNQNNKQICRGFGYGPTENREFSK